MAEGCGSRPLAGCLVPAIRDAGADGGGVLPGSHSNGRICAHYDDTHVGFTCMREQDYLALQRASMPSSGWSLTTAGTSTPAKPGRSPSRST